MSRRTALAFSLLLVVFAARLTHTAVEKSFTVDEPHYVGMGLYLWQTGDYHYFRALRHQPPLAFHLASVPLLFLDLGDVRVDPFIGRRLLSHSQPSSHVIRVASRLPFVLLACWTAVLAFLWAREAAGDAAGLLALFLTSFSPMLLAHGSLVHSDIAITAFFLQTFYALWRWYRRPTPGRLALVGLSLGLAAIAKLTAVLLLAMLLVVWVALAAGLPLVRGAAPIGPGGAARRVAWAAATGAAVVAIAALVVWAGYGGSFRSYVDPHGRFPDLRLPGYLQAFLFLTGVNAEGRTTYFLGEFAQRGWWYYFPLAFALKEPIGETLLLLFATAALAARPSALGRFLAVPILGYTGLLVFWVDVPLGLRYALPLFPLLFVFTGTQLAPLALGRPAVRGAVLAVCGWIAVASLWFHPHYLAYFNEAAGGPRAGARYLLDSDLDWGQDLPALARWLEARGRPVVKIAYHGPEKPEAYGIRSEPLRGCEPTTGLVAISANVLHGYSPPGNPFDAPVPGCYDWLLRHEPVARPGYSILVYDLPGPPSPP